MPEGARRWPPSYKSRLGLRQPAGVGSALEARAPCKSRRPRARPGACRADQFESQPVRGLGAGNYKLTYFRERRTTEDIRQPHSIELQVLAELGLVGMVALALFVVAVLFALARRSWRARVDSTQISIVVAAGGTFTFWLIHTSVDWLHLIPGATGLALCAAACLVGPSRRPRAGQTRGWFAVAIGGAVLVLVGAALVGRATLAERYRLGAEQALRDDPRGAMTKGG